MRVRHVYVRALRAAERFETAAPALDVTWRPPSPSDRAELARLMLDAFLLTIDYEGEGMTEARLEVERHFDSSPLLDDSTLSLVGGEIVSACLLREWPKRQRPLVAFVMTASTAKCRGLAASCLGRSLERLASSGVPSVHAVITQGNVASERLFGKFGFTRTT